MANRRVGNGLALSPSPALKHASMWCKLTVQSVLSVSHCIGLSKKFCVSSYELIGPEKTVVVDTAQKMRNESD